MQITSDEGHDRGLLFLRAVALGWSEGSSSARPFSWHQWKAARADRIWRAGRAGGQPD